MTKCVWAYLHPKKFMWKINFSVILKQRNFYLTFFKWMNNSLLVYFPFVYHYFCVFPSFLPTACLSFCFPGCCLTYLFLTCFFYPLFSYLLSCLVIFVPACFTPFIPPYLLARLRWSLPPSHCSKCKIQPQVYNIVSICIIHVPLWWPYPESSWMFCSICSQNLLWCYIRHPDSFIV